jgi:hypothetical protein
LGRECHPHGFRADEVLTKLNRGSELAGDCAAANIVVVPDRLLDPIEPFVIERAAAVEGFGQGQRLV